MDEREVTAKLMRDIGKARSGDTLAIAQVALGAVQMGLNEAEERIQKLQAENASLRAQLKDALAASKTEAEGG